MKILNTNTKVESNGNLLVKVTRLVLSGMLMLICCGLGVSSASAQAKDIYITPDGAPTGNCTNNVHALSWFNSSGNWGSGSAQIGPGTTVHLCGTFTSELDPQGNGNASNRITLFFEPGANFSKPVWNSQALYFASTSFWVIDGGTPCGSASTKCNGFIQNTANGTTLANQVSFTNGIVVSGAHDLEIKNLGIYNLYVHTSVADDKIDPTISGCVYANGVGVNLNIHDNTFHDDGWCINLENQAQGNLNLNIQHNYLYNTSHGIAIGGCAPGAGTIGITIAYNRISGPAIWDTTSDSYHHDGIHVFPLPSGNVCSNLTINNNVFDGDWGVTNTSALFLENHSDQNENIIHVKVMNNTFSSANGHIWNNGINVVAFNDVQIFNNTVMCPGAGIGFTVSGTNIDMRNNVITGCSTAIQTFLNTNTLAHLDNNVYANLSNAGGNPAFIWNGKSSSAGGSISSQLTQWRSITGGDAAALAISSLGLSANGAPQAGSQIIGAAANLTSLGIGSLDLDLLGNLRPSSGPWTAGAISDSSSASAPAPPTGLTATVGP